MTQFKIGAVWYPLWASIAFITVVIASTLIAKKTYAPTSFRSFRPWRRFRTVTRDIEKDIHTDIEKTIEEDILPEEFLGAVDMRSASVFWDPASCSLDSSEEGQLAERKSN